ncbi:hypothetical protein [Streptomyces sp. HB132]|uniref:hypothetical protein n=1 Tax=Streptomyces sp. HB132 TaxID=767388 RepID=UPI001960F526|nr:hypothetical protein [Streptomyces sp. HB132]MBM7442114.1 hypothetical protein [Streptomyces sp. HB132]
MTEHEIEPPARRSTTKAIATALCVALLLVLHAVGGFFLLNALLAESEGPWDSNVTGTVRALAGLGVATELLAAAVTVAFVSLVHLRRRWCLIPCVLILVAAVRMVSAPTP